jgi:cysteine desulfurase
VHSFGRNAKKQLEAARKTVADAISAWPNEVTFVGSGTEANITALRGSKAKRIFISAIEHSSVLRSREDITLIPVLENGTLDLSALDALLRESTEPALVSLMLANNETGVIQPVFEASQLCKSHGALLHCDAVQALGKIAVDFGALGADMMTLSAHKCGGPLGAAALVIRRELPLTALLTGGGQESGRRAGTENIAAICAFAVALEKAPSLAHLAVWRDSMEQNLTAHGAVIFGKDAPRLPNTSCIALPEVSNEVQLMDLDLGGFAVSAGSACSSGRIEVSHVLTAMKNPKELAACAIRISSGWGTTQQELENFTNAWIKMCCRLGKSKLKAAANS